MVMKAEPESKRGPVGAKARSLFLNLSHFWGDICERVKMQVSSLKFRAVDDIADHLQPGFGVGHEGPMLGEYTSSTSTRYHENVHPEADSTPSDLQPVGNNFTNSLKSCTLLKNGIIPADTFEDDQKTLNTFDLHPSRSDFKKKSRSMQHCGDKNTFSDLQSLGKNFKNTFKSVQLSGDENPPTDLRTLGDDGKNTTTDLRTLRGDGKNISVTDNESVIDSKSDEQKRQDAEFRLLKRKKKTDGHDIPSDVCLSLSSHCKNLLVLVVGLAFLANPALATKPTFSKQQLPPDCIISMERRGYDCPVFRDRWDMKFYEVYNRLNQTCCAGFPGLDFHCQMDYDSNGVQYSMFGCMGTVSVGDNKGVRIVDYDTDRPSVAVSELTDGVSHGPRLSWQVPFPYGTVKQSQCSETGQEILCQTSTGDRKCICKFGYGPSNVRKTKEKCVVGFNDDDECWCEKLLCPDGFCPVRIFPAESFGPNVSCVELDLSLVNFTCSPCNDTTITDSVQPHSATTPPAHKETLSTTTPGQKGPSKPEDDVGKIVGIVFCIFGGVLALFVVLMLLFVRAAPNICSHNYNYQSL